MKLSALGCAVSPYVSGERRSTYPNILGSIEASAVPIRARVGVIEADAWETDCSVNGLIEIVNERHVLLKEYTERPLQAIR